MSENKAVAILAEVQAGRPALIQKDGGEMLIAIVLDKPLAEAKALVDDPAAFTCEMTRILREKQSHPLIAQMMKPAESSFFSSSVADVALMARSLHESKQKIHCTRTKRSLESANRLKQQSRKKTSRK